MVRERRKKGMALTRCRRQREAACLWQIIVRSASVAEWTEVGDLRWRRR